MTFHSVLYIFFLHLTQFVDFYFQISFYVNFGHDIKFYYCMIIQQFELIDEKCSKYNFIITIIMNDVRV